MIYYIFFIVLLLGAIWCAWRISVADLRRRIIPDAYLFPLMLIGLLAVVFIQGYPCSVHDAAIGAAFGYSLGAAVGFVFDCIQRRRNPSQITPPIGMGDIKLLGVGGLWLGPTGLAMALVLASLFAAIWHRIRRQRFIPFAPFFISGAFLTLLGMLFLL